MTTPTTYVKGDLVTLTTQVRAEPVNSYGTQSFPVGTVGEVRQITTKKLLIRVPIRVSWTTDPQEGSIWVDKIGVTPHVVDPDAPKPRKLGETPEGMISPDDPRLQWLWDDAGTFAEQKGYCSQYDALADHLNIPGREREFTVTQKIGNLEVKAKIKARSRKLAEAQVAAELKAAVA